MPCKHENAEISTQGVYQYCHDCGAVRMRNRNRMGKWEGGTPVNFARHNFTKRKENSMPPQNDAVRELAERIASDIGSRMPYKGAAEVAERIIRDAIRPLLAAVEATGSYGRHRDFMQALERLRDEAARWKEPGR